MKKRMCAFAIGLAVTMTASPGWTGVDVTQELAALKEQNRLLMERIGKLEKQVAENQNTQAEIETKLEKAAQGPMAQLNERVSISGLIEAEATSGHAFDHTDSSDISLATVELGIDANISEWSTGHILFKYEDGTNLRVDEGTITLGNRDKSPLYLTAGKMYVPFGNFASNMISDPLTLNLGETNEDAVLVGFEKEGFYGATYAFNGDVKEIGKDNLIRGVGATLGYGFEQEHVSLDTGLGWNSNIADSNGITDGLNNLGAENAIAGQIGGISAHLVYNHNSYGLIAEYTAATESFAAANLDFRGQGAKPKAWNLELSHTTEIMGRETTFAIGYQGSNEALALGLPEARYMGSLGFSLMDYTSLAFEYIHDEDYEVSDGGTGNDAQSVTMQLAVEF